jgi:ribosomal protein S18 acetylase RimI-like enzyme
VAVTGYFQAAPRAIHNGDAEAARALVVGVLGLTPYVDRTIELLEAAERGDSECLALIIERDGTVAALALFGPVAGASNAWHLPAILLAPEVGAREVGRAMIEGVIESIRARSGRLLVAELPADAVLGRSLSLLRANGFKEEGRVRDFFRDGVALLFLRRDL